MCRKGTIFNLGYLCCQGSNLTAKWCLFSFVFTPMSISTTVKPELAEKLAETAVFLDYTSSYHQQQNHRQRCPDPYSIDSYSIYDSLHRPLKPPPKFRFTIWFISTITKKSYFCLHYALCMKSQYWWHCMWVQEGVGWVLH